MVTFLDEMIEKKCIDKEKTYLRKGYWLPIMKFNNPWREY